MRKLPTYVKDFKVENFDHMRISGRVEQMTFNSVIRGTDFLCAMECGKLNWTFRAYIEPGSVERLEDLRDRIEHETATAVALLNLGHPGHDFPGRRITREQIEAPYTLSEVKAWLEFNEDQDKAMAILTEESSERNLKKISSGLLQELGIPVSVTEEAWEDDNRPGDLARRLTQRANQWMREAPPVERLTSICQMMCRQHHANDKSPGLVDRFRSRLASTFNLGKISMSAGIDKMMADFGVRPHVLTMQANIAGEYLATTSLAANFVPEPKVESDPAMEEMIGILKAYRVKPDQLMDMIKMKRELDESMDFAHG